jgi:hypothetical protein
MDRDPIREHELDQILAHTFASALRSLDATTDVQQRLDDLYRDLKLDPDSASNDQS